MLQTSFVKTCATVCRKRAALRARAAYRPEADAVVAEPGCDPGIEAAAGRSSHLPAAGAAAAVSAHLIDMETFPGGDGGIFHRIPVWDGQPHTWRELEKTVN